MIQLDSTSVFVLLFYVDDDDDDKGSWNCVDISLTKLTRPKLELVQIPSQNCLP